MRFISTRGKAKPCSLSEAIVQGLASDGGLFVPETWPAFKIEKSWAKLEFGEFAARVLMPFFAGDPLADKLKQICKQAFAFPIPLRGLSDNVSVLELFYGPTHAFKDFGARFLALAIGLIPDPRASERVVLVATSGDTGGAVASAFCHLTKIPVIILYPQDGISKRQEKQLTVWGEQVQAFAVKGSFDDCQNMVKQAFASAWWKNRYNLISANSINIARLLPQMAYFAWASLRYYEQHGITAGLIIPSGNLGNSVAALWAQKIGFPIRKVIFAHNANAAVADFFAGKPWAPQPTKSTLANAMDVGNPSNFERVLNLYPQLEQLQKVAAATSVSDAEICKAITHAGNELWCPHTATAIHVLHQQTEQRWIIAATAHPAKFDSIIEPLIGKSIAVPAGLKTLLERPSRSRAIAANLTNLQDAISAEPVPS